MQFLFSCVEGGRGPSDANEVGNLQADGILQNGKGSDYTLRGSCQTILFAEAHAVVEIC